MEIVAITGLSKLNKLLFCPPSLTQKDLIHMLQMISYYSGQSTPVSGPEAAPSVVGPHEETLELKTERLKQ